MRTASFRLLTLLAVASLSAAACGDDGGGNGSDGVYQFLPGEAYYDRGDIAPAAHYDVGNIE